MTVSVSCQVIRPNVSGRQTRQYFESCCVRLRSTSMEIHGWDSCVEIVQLICNVKCFLDIHGLLILLRECISIDLLCKARSNALQRGTKQIGKYPMQIEVADVPWKMDSQRNNAVSECFLYSI